MAERKGLNKYYPPDFDPAKIPKRRMPDNQQNNIRTMLPMSIRCNTCGNYIYKGTKLNSRKEDAIGETYLGIQVLRFYSKCTDCSAEITVKTDWQNSDYALECGASRNFEPWREEDEVVDEDPTLVFKREMDIRSALDELKSMKSRQSTVSLDAMLEALKQTAPVQQEDKFEEEDEALIKSIFQKFVHRIDDDELLDDDDIILSGFNRRETSQVKSKKMRVSEQVSDNPSFVFKSSKIKFSVVKKPLEAGGVKTEANENEQEDDEAKSTSNALQSLCQQYDIDDDDEE